MGEQGLDDDEGELGGDVGILITDCEKGISGEVEYIGG